MLKTNLFVSCFVDVTIGIKKFEKSEHDVFFEVQRRECNCLTTDTERFNLQRGFNP